MRNLISSDMICQNAERTNNIDLVGKCSLQTIWTFHINTTFIQQPVVYSYTIQLVCLGMVTASTIVQFAKYNFSYSL